MLVKDVMTKDPACCTPETTLREAAQMLADHDCGALPVLDSQGVPQGVITDRDIALRAVAQGQGPDTPVSRVMSGSVITVTPESSLEECCDQMEEKQIRRIIVVDGDGNCCGIVAQADVALHTSPAAVAEVLRDVSQPSGSARCC
jgi:CBS domain-containing protein